MRFPLSETSAKWAPIYIPLVFGLVWLFNSYKLGRLNMKWFTSMSEHQRKLFLRVILVSIVGILLVCAVPLILKAI